MKQEKFYTFTYDLMFCEVLNNNPDIAKRIIEIILDKKIRKIENVEVQKNENYSLNSRGVRFDVFVKDDENTHYDVEIQTSRFHELPKRMRYYQSANDSTYIKRGDDFESLPESYIIFLCTKDPFGLGESIYRFKTNCLEHPQMNYNEGAYKIVLNSQGKRNNISKELNDFLNYIETNIPVDNLSNNINDRVIEINSNSDWRHQIMTLEDKIRIERKTAREEGKAEGRIEGKAEGLAEGIKEGEEKTRNLVAKRLKEVLGLSDEQIKEIIKEDNSK